MCIFQPQRGGSSFWRPRRAWPEDSTFFSRKMLFSKKMSRRTTYSPLRSLMTSSTVVSRTYGSDGALGAEEGRSPLLSGAMP